MLPAPPPLSTVFNAAKAIRLMGFDVDGVLTDGTLFFDGQGEVIKPFNAKDGHGLKMLMKAGVEVVIITARRSAALSCRTANLGITELHMDISDKRACFLNLVHARGLNLNQTGFMGDDVIDLPIMSLCGFSAAPADAHPFVKTHAHYISTNPGGRAAAREVCDLILNAQGQLEAMQKAYLGQN